MKPCPWCGKQPRRRPDNPGISNTEAVGCFESSCPIYGILMTLEQWNSRPDLEAELEKMPGDSVLCRVSDNGWIVVDNVKGFDCPRPLRKDRVAPTPSAAVQKAREG